MTLFLLTRRRFFTDGARLMLTHYCAAQNQPRMVAKQFDPAKDELAFEFFDITNLKDPKAGHMRNARFRFLDANRFTSEWSLVSTCICPSL